jgi:hypothetical protein
MKRFLATALPAFALAIAPTAHAAADVSRSSAPVDQVSQFGGDSTVPLILLAAIIGGAIWLIIDANNNDNNNPVSTG